MIDKLLGLVQEFAGSSVINNPQVPDAKNNVAIKSIADGVLGGLKQQAAGDGFGNIIGMLTNGGNVSSAVSKSVQTSVVESLIAKAGLNSGVAKSIAGQIVPSILSSLSHKSADKSNSHFDIGDILHSLTDGKSAGLNVQSLIDSGVGNGDGKLDLNDVISFLGKTQSGSKTKTGSQSGGGLLGALGGLLGG